MKLLDKVFKKKPVEREESGVEALPVDPGYTVIDEYYVKEPYSKIKIVTSPELGEGLYYFVEETELNQEQYDTY